MLLLTIKLLLFEGYYNDVSLSEVDSYVQKLLVFYLA